jgi:hypothetical protein
LIASLLYIPKFDTINIVEHIFNSTGDTRCILDGRELFNYFKVFFKIKNKSEYIKTICQHKLYFKNDESIDIYRDFIKGHFNDDLHIVIEYEDIVKYLGLPKIIDYGTILAKH